MIMTIKELADQLGVSKTAVRNYMDEDFRRKHTESNRNGSITIDSDGCKLIAESMGKNWKESEHTKNPLPKTDENTEIQQLRDEVAFLREQLRAKDRQLDARDKQIADLTEAVKAQALGINGAQALHAGTIHHLSGGKPEAADHTDSAIDADPGEATAQAQPVPEPKKRRQGFWAWITGG